MNLKLLLAVPLLLAGENILIQGECVNNPCENNGTCETTQSGPICHCEVGFYGNTCENVGYAYSYTRLISADKTLMTSTGHIVTDTALETDVIFVTSYTTPLVVQNTLGVSGPVEYDCLCTRYGNTSDEEVDQKVLTDKIQDELLLDKSTLTKTLLKYISLEDDRPSAKGIGGVGSVIIVLSVLVIVVPDVLRVFKYVYHSGKKFKPAKRD